MKTIRKKIEEIEIKYWYSMDLTVDAILSLMRKEVLACLPKEKNIQKRCGFDHALYGNIDCLTCIGYKYAISDIRNALEKKMKKR